MPSPVDDARPSMSDAVRRPARPSGPREVVSFARRDGRRHARIVRRWDERHDAWEIHPERLERDASLAPGWVLDPVAAFGRTAPLVVEIGSGTGEAILASARERPDWNHLAVEVYRPGAAKTLLRAVAGGLANVRLLQADAAALLRTGLPAQSVTELRVFFPDPWPKPRHHKRRLVTPALVADAARVLVDDGVVRLATDWEDYARQMTEALAGEPALVTLDGGVCPRWDGRPLTSFERKGIAAGRRVVDLTAVRRSRG